jgi:predicted transcriptional regulator
MATTVTTSLKLDATLKERIQKLAEARDRSPHYVMREAIAEYVSREEAREEAWSAADKAWEEFQRTGLHATHEEVDAWLAKLEAGEDAEPPECHT